MRKRNRRGATLTYEMACELLQPVFSDPTAFAVDIYREIQKQNLSKVYLAAPPAEIAFITTLRDKLNRRGIKVLTFEDAENFIVRNYFDCPHFRVSLVNPFTNLFYRMGNDKCKIFDKLIGKISCFFSKLSHLALPKRYNFNCLIIIFLLKQ